MLVRVGSRVLSGGGIVGVVGREGVGLGCDVENGGTFDVDDYVLIEPAHLVGRGVFRCVSIQRVSCVFMHVKFKRGNRVHDI